jgi:uncharacterized protein with ParB-like and HNH nuclease domain
MATIESQNLSISKLFNDFYVIPSYQCEYVWESQQVRDFFEDLYGEFEEIELKKSLTSAIKNETFDNKKGIYPKSKIRLKKIPDKFQIGKNTASDRAV